MIYDCSKKINRKSYLVNMLVKLIRVCIRVEIILPYWRASLTRAWVDACPCGCAPMWNCFCIKRVARVRDARQYCQRRTPILSEARACVV